MAVDEILQSYFRRYSLLYMHNEEQILALTKEILQSYSQSGRYYHNADHIAALLLLADEYQDYIDKPSCMGFAILYHDIIYDVSKSDNEEQSAYIATERLEQLGVSPEIITDVRRYILATKKHELSEGDDNTVELALFLDFDLSVLGASPEFYDAYAQNIRREYAVYEDAVYYPGRKAVLQAFLQKPHLYHTQLFRESYEQQARANIEREIISCER